MRTKFMLAAVVAGVCGAIAAPAGLASAEESAQELISRLQGEGYTVNIDRDRHRADEQMRGDQRPKPSAGHPVGALHRARDKDGDRVLVEVVTSQSISVTLDCSR